MGEQFSQLNDWERTKIMVMKAAIVLPLFSEAKIVDKNTIKYKGIALYQLFNCFIKEAIKKVEVL
jgi:hypothetical protein